MLGSTNNPTPINPPGTAYSNSLFSAKRDTTLDLIGVHLMLPFSSFQSCPGLISTSIPTLMTPQRILPPTTPPTKSSILHPGLFTSKLLMMIILGGTWRLLFGIGILFRDWQTASMLYLNCAEMGMMGAFQQRVDLMNYLICLQFSRALSSSLKMISTLFCKIMMWSSLTISKATKCSDVCGWGQSMLAAIKSKAASITAAPVNIVERRISCPGQSTKEICLALIQSYFKSTNLLSHLSQLTSSSFELGNDLKHSGSGHFQHLQIFALAQPNLMVIFLNISGLNLTVLTDEIALTTVDFPWATCPMVPMLRVACLLMTCGDEGVRVGMSSYDCFLRCGEFFISYSTSCSDSFVDLLLVSMWIILKD